MRGLGADLRFALRMMARSPGATAVAVVTLAVAIGANTAIFSVVDGVLLRPLPYQRAARLVSIWEKAPEFPEMSVSYPDYLDWRKSQRAFEELAAFRVTGYTLTGVDRPERLEGRMMSAELVPLVGATPVLGRNFSADEDRPGGEPVALLSDRFWRRRFGADPAIVGRALGLDGRPVRVVGILPAGFNAIHRFAGVDRADIYTPLGQLDPAMARRGNHPGIVVLGRLKPGITLEQARAHLEAIGRALGEPFASNTGVLPALAPLHADLVREVRPTLLLLMGAVGFVLLIAVANVANLALARGSARRREMAVRAALGAGRARLVRQLLCESTLTSLAGGALGVLGALWGVDALAAARADSLPAAAPIQIDLRVLAFSLGVSVAAGILFGLVPALAVSGRLSETLKEADLRASSGTAHARLRSTLVVAEVALALVLLLGAGLSLRSIVHLAHLDPGFRSDGVTTMTLTLPRDRYQGARLRALLAEIEGRLLALPGVDAAALSAGVPLAGGSETSFWVDGRPPPGPSDVAFAVYYPTTSGFHRALGIPLVAGRAFTADDQRPDGLPVAIVDERLASHFFPGRSAVGMHLILGPQRPPVEIVGVARHVAHYGLGVPEPAPFQFYLPWSQFPDDALALMARELNVTLRSQQSKPALLAAVGSVLAGLDRDVPVYEVHEMTELARDALGQRRFALSLLGLFAALALGLATLGLYAVLSFAVSQRTHEIGVRMALGARAGDVRAMVLRQALQLVAVGLALGGLGALALGRVMSSLLYQTSAADPLTLCGVAMTLAAAAGLASFLPARRATRVDPMVALRGE
jgi:predicted permease